MNNALKSWKQRLRKTILVNVISALSNLIDGMLLP